VTQPASRPEDDKMKKLRIADNFALPAEAVTQTFAILGIRGSGKTNTGVVIAEELLAAGQQVVIIDPVDVWWGLKSSRDGRTGGFPVPVIGGDHSDVPLDAAAGAVLADFVVDARASVILSLRHLSMGDQRRFAADFAKRLYDRKGSAQHRSPLMLIVDEADEFVPQRIPHGHEATFGAFDRLVRRGRSSGIGITLISQRAQVINKDVLSQMETLVGMRVLHKLDRKALEAWTEAHDTEGHQEEFLSSLASLSRGEAWIWSPSWLGVFQRIQIRARKTFDSSATPKAGEKIAPPKELAPIDLEQLRERMSAQIAKAEADDPRKLRARIAQLAAVAVDDTQLNDAYTSGYRAGVAAEHARLLGYIGAASDTIESAVKGLLHGAREGKRQPSAPPPVSRPSPPAQPRQPAQHVTEARPPVNGSGKISKGGRRILTALAQFGESADTKVGALSGLVPSAGHFGNVLSELRAAGLIEGERSALRITDAGLNTLGSYDPLPTGRELHAWWLARLPKGAGEILEELIRAYPRSLSDQEIGERIGKVATAGHFGNMLSELRKRELIVGPRSGLRASEDLFAESSGRVGV
jgi:hypothetical protein